MFRTPESTVWLLGVLQIAACTSAEANPGTTATARAASLATSARGQAPSEVTSMQSPSPAFLPDITFRLPYRTGVAPEVSDSPAGTTLAHRQLTQQSPSALQEQLFQRAATLPYIHTAPSGISVPGARAFVLAQNMAKGPAEAFQIGQEFAHIHPTDDGSLHMKLPPSCAELVFARGWGVPHPRSGTPLVYGPRDEAELEIVWQLLLRSYAWAREGLAVEIQG